MNKKFVLVLVVVAAPVLLGAEGSGCKERFFKFEIDIDQRLSKLPSKVRDIRALDIADNGDVLVCAARRVWRVHFPAAKEQPALWIPLCSFHGSQEFLRAQWGPREGEVLVLRRIGRRQDVCLVLRGQCRALTSSGDITDFAASPELGLAVVRSAEHAGWVVEWPENQRDPIGFRSRPYGVLLRDRWLGAPTLLWAEQREQGSAIWALPVREGGKKRPVASGQGFTSSPLVAMPDGTVGWGLGNSKTLVSDFQDQAEGHPKRVQHEEDGELFSSSQSGEYIAVLLENGRTLARMTLGEQLHAPKRSEQPSAAETPAIPEVEDAGP